MKDKQPILNLTLRLPERMAAELKHKAIDNRRSLNSEIACRLEQSLKQEVGNDQATTA